MKIRQSAYFDGSGGRNTEQRERVLDTDSTLNIVVAAGGTGGHLFPALAVVEQLRELTHDHLNVFFLGSEDRMEATLIPSYGYPYTPMPIAGFKGLTHPSTFSLPLKILSSMRIARRVIREAKADVVLVTGAYISFPAGRAAVAEGVPLVIMESNVNPGKSNAKLAPHAAAIIASFEESRAFFSDVIQDRIHVLGNPVRNQISTSMETEAARVGFGLDGNAPTVLVFGGSLGARSINHAVQTMVDRWAATHATPEWQLLWQTGRDYTATIPQSLTRRVSARPFIDDMGSAYAAADLVVSRSGATTIAELGIVGKPAILVPLPSASTNEQRHNAKVVEQRGGAIVVEDGDLASQLSDTIEAVMLDERRRSTMAQAMQTLGRPDAAREASLIVQRIAQEDTRS